MSFLLKGKGVYNFLKLLFKIGIPLAIVGALIFIGTDIYRQNFQTKSYQSNSYQGSAQSHNSPASENAPGYTAAAQQQNKDEKCANVPTHAEIPQQPSEQQALPNKEQALQELNFLTVTQREGWKTYCRDAFGEALQADFDRNGCSARQETLKRTARDLKTIPVKRQYGTCDEVLSATWTDPYNGKVVHIDNMKSQDSDKIQIDHMVPLFNAWISGADKWTPEQRAIFAADVSSQELWAVDGDVNQAKGNMAPDEWKPDAPYQCTYAKAFTSVKARYKLIVTDKEKQALSDMLGTCQS